MRLGVRFAAPSRRELRGVQDPNPRVRRGVPSSDLSGRVDRMIVDDQDFEVNPLLAQQRVDGGAEVPGFIAGRDDHGDSVPFPRRSRGHPDVPVRATAVVDREMNRVRQENRQHQRDRHGITF